MQSENHYTETDLGNVAPNPRGNFDSTAKYEYLDLVSMQGGSYLCIAELGQTITGIAPEAGKNTEHWQCVAIPGNMTPEYTDAYGKVVRLAREVEQDAAKVAEDKQSVTQMETNARQLKEQAEESARQAENSKDSAAGSAREAKKAEESARQAENNVRTLVNGFDTHVEEKTTEATQVIAETKDDAIQAIGRQEAASVQAVKDQTTTYITEQKNLAKQELDKKVEQFGIDVNAIKAEVSEEGQKQITNVQGATTAELAKITEKGTEQTEAVAKEGTKQVQAVQAAAQEIVADREQINTNKEGIAQLKEDIAILEAWNKQLQDALISQKTTTTNNNIKVTNSAKLPIVKLSVFGKSEQNGVPTTENPVPIVSAGESGNIGVKITGKNLINVSEDAISSNCDAGSYTIKNGVIAFNTVNNWGGDFLYFNDIDVSKDKELVFRMEATLPEKQDTETDGAKILFKAYNKSGEEIKDSESAISNDTRKMAYNDYYKGLTYYKRGSNISVEFSSMVARIKVGVCFLDSIAGKAVTIRDYQAEYGTTSTAYEPYKEQTIALQTPNGLLGLKVNSGGNYTDSTGQQWICDEIDLARGKYVQRIRKIVLDGNIDTKHVGQHENGTKYLGIILQEKDYTLKASNMLCTRYIRAEWTNENGYVYSAKKDTVIITDNRFTDVETTKKIIGEEKPVIIYPLLTPIETDLPPETIAAFKRLRTNYPNTIISNNADAEMELTYIADTKLYVKKELEKIVSAQIQDIANLLSLMPLETQAGMIETDVNNILENVEEMKYE